MNVLKLIQDYKELNSINKVAILNNLKYFKVYSILKKEKVPMVSKNTKNLPNIPTALEEYKNGSSLNNLHKKYGFDHNVFKKILKENNIKYINRSINSLDGEIVIIRNNLKEILKEYSKNKNVRKTSKLFKVKECNLYRFLKSNNLLKRKQERVNSDTEAKIKNEIYDLYVNKKFNTADISKKIGLTRYNVKKILTSNFGDSCIRSKKEITREMNYKEEHQIKCHNGSLKRKLYKLPSGEQIKVQGYEDDFLNYVFEKTKLQESDFNFKKRLKIEMSTKEVKNKNYYPDFYLNRYNLVIEIKSDYIYELQKKLNLKKERKTKEKGYYYLLIKDKNYKKFNTFLKKHNLLK